MKVFMQFIPALKDSGHSRGTAKTWFSSIRMGSDLNAKDAQGAVGIRRGDRGEFFSPK